MGVEPTQDCSYSDLNAACLPISPRRLFLLIKKYQAQQKAEKKYLRVESYYSIIKRFPTLMYQSSIFEKRSRGNKILVTSKPLSLLK